jgi:hypothetical protein
MSKVNKKQAPQQTVVSISRYGEWGKVEYAHKLECGHTEIRKRASRAPQIACEQCVKANTAKQMLSKFVPVKIEEDFSWEDDIASSIAKTEQDIGRLRAGIAAKFNIGPESIDVVTEETEDGALVSYVVIVLDAEQALLLANSPRSSESQSVS